MQALKASSRRFWIVLAISVACTVAALALSSMQFALLQDAETYTEDLRTRVGRKTPANDQLVLIGIDRPFYERSHFREDDLRDLPALEHLFQPFPWSRELWAELVTRLCEAGAKAVLIDVVFAAEREEDEIFRRVLERYRDRVVIGYEITNLKTDRGDFISWRFPSSSLIPVPPDGHPVTDPRLGFVTVWGEEGVVREASYRLSGDRVGDPLLGDTILESLTARGLRHAGLRDRIPEGTGDRQFRYTAPPGEGFRPHPIGDVLLPRLWERTYGSGEFFRDKFVLIGPTAEIFQDAHATPFKAVASAGSERDIVLQSMPGPELHLNILNAALHGEFLNRLSAGATRSIAAMAGLLAAALSFLIRQPVRRLFGLAALVVAWWYVARWTFDRGGLILPIALPLIVLVGSSVMILAYDVVLERLERMKLRHTMGLYFSPRVLEAVLADPGSMEPRRAEVTLLLTDLRNSTPLAEALGPQGMFELLNRVFEAQTGAIMNEEGNLEHFLGDQFLSYWGAPQAQADAADRARRAAVRLIEAMEALRKTLPEPVSRLFGYGVALHSGSVLVGNKGSALRLDYGLVGDTVNEAARIEALTKYYGVKLLVSRETFAQFTGRGMHRLIDRVIVKGKSEPVDLFECENPCVRADYPELCRRYEAAFDQYVQGRFAEAGAEFARVADEFQDGAARVLGARCERLAGAPTPDWNGIWKMESK